MRGLRRRLVATFALVAAVVAAALAATSWLLVSRALQSRAEDEAVAEARAALAEVTDRLPPSPGRSEVGDAIGRLRRHAPYEVVAVLDGGGFETTSVSLSDAAVPARLRALVEGGRLGWARTGSGSRASVVVGGTVPDGPSLYFFFPLADVVDDLVLLRNVLVAAGGGLVAVSAGVGLAAARGLLRPIRRARTAAYRLEVGLLDTRLPDEGADEFADLAHSFNRMAAALERTIGELRTLEASHRRFVSDVSHELRTPLTALTAAADVLEANLDGLGEQGRRAARLLLVETRRLAATVDDLMEISRFDAGAAGVVWEPLDLSAHVAAALDARGWTDRVEVAAPAPARTYADPRRVDAIVGNLVGNALEHGAPPVQVEVEATADRVTLAVADRGPGVPPEHLPRIFERFYKADAARPRRPGSGLGLAIARENARLLGGDVEAGGNPGGGARFACWLPVRTGPPDDGHATVAEPLPPRDPAVMTARQPVIAPHRRRRAR